MIFVFFKWVMFNFHVRFFLRANNTSTAYRGVSLYKTPSNTEQWSQLKGFDTALGTITRTIIYTCSFSGTPSLRVQRWSFHPWSWELGSSWLRLGRRMSTNKKGVKNLIGGKTSSPDHSNKSKKNTSFHLKYFQQLLCCPNIKTNLFHYKQRSNSWDLHPLNPSDSPPVAMMVMLAPTLIALPVGRCSNSVGL